MLDAFELVVRGKKPNNIVMRNNMFRSVAIVISVAMTSLISKSTTFRPRYFVASFSSLDYTTNTNSRALHCKAKDAFSSRGYPYSHRSEMLPGVLQMSTTSISGSASVESTTGIVPRVKAVDAKASTDGSPVLVKGWVRTIRKQKTLAFVEVNDGSNMNGIQCVLSFDTIDEESKKGRFSVLQ